MLELDKTNNENEAMQSPKLSDSGKTERKEQEAVYLCGECMTEKIITGMFRDGLCNKCADDLGVRQHHLYGGN